MKEEFLTVADIAELLKLNQQTVRNWIDQGKLPAVRIGRRIRVRRSTLDHLLAQGETAPAPAANSAIPDVEARAELASIVERARGLLGSSDPVPEAELTECLQRLTDALEPMLQRPGDDDISKSGKPNPELAA